MENQAQVDYKNENERLQARVLLLESQLGSAEQRIADLEKRSDAIEKRADYLSTRKFPDENKLDEIFRFMKNLDNAVWSLRDERTKL